MNYNNPLVSIVIPIYKVEKFLPACIESCLNQTYTNIEIIAVNDGSPDECGTIIDSYAERSNKIKHIRVANGGTAAARDNGVKNSCGEYILFLDGDDLLLENCVERLVESAKECGADMVFSDAYYLYSNGERELLAMNPEKLSINSGIEFLESRIATFIWSKLIRRDYLLNLKIQSVNISEDYYAMLQILPLCKKVVCLPEPLYYYRQHAASIMNGNIQTIVEGWLQHAVDRQKLIANLQLTETVKDNILFDNVHIIYRYIKLRSKNEKKSSKENLNQLISYTHTNYPLNKIRKWHTLKLYLFLIAARYFPKTLNRYL